MNYNVVLSHQADTDLRAIFSYIAVELQSLHSASKQLERLEKSIMSLEALPNRFRAYGKEPWNSRGLRVMPVDNYCVFYIPDSSKNTVTIISVMYGGRDIDAQLARFISEKY